jgi:hypothetical protein
MFFKDEKINTYIISIIWGLGIAALFRKICDNDRCIVIKAPANMLKYKQQSEEQCYNFERENIECVTDLS